MSTGLIISITLAYLGLLFGIAYLAERMSQKGHRWVSSPVVYALSLAVYCTAWTFFGSVGRAATSGLSFLTIYLGPTIAAPLWIIVLRKIILIGKNQRTTSVADFISSRYGKSTLLGSLATLIAVFGVIPYISIQLKAITSGLDLMMYQSTHVIDHRHTPFFLDSALYVTMILALFAILFGTRHLDPNERHTGLVAAIAFESVLKLVAFLLVGIVITFGIFNGFEDLFSQGLDHPNIARLYSLDQLDTSAWEWFWLGLLSLFAFMLLPRQFHIMVVENEQADHVRTASWLLPLYLLLINLFVLPIAVAGLLLFQGTNVEPDTFVIMLPLLEGLDGLAFFVALGGFSAATGMVIVASIALSIMISNNLVLPLIIRPDLMNEQGDTSLPYRLIWIRRLSIIVVLLLAYGYYKSVGEDYSLVSIGLISFTAVAQFAPAVIAGLYWKRATKSGAFAGLVLGFLIWAYTLPLPTLVETGLLSGSFLENGLLGISWLKPYALFGMEGVDHVSHAAFWSLTFNSLALILVSLNTKLTANEIAQADLFVDIHKYRKAGGDFELRSRNAPVRDIKLLLTRFLGKGRADYLIRRFEQRYRIDLNTERVAQADLVNYAETHLAGAIGAASAKVIIGSIAKEDPISLEEMFKLLEQTQEIMQYSRALEKKSTELEQTTQQLRTANEQLKELDHLKADFITTVTHELRTPITSIKALAKILLDNKSLPIERRAEFLDIIVNESERIARLINQVLDLEKIQSTETSWQVIELDLREVVAEVVHRMGQMMEEKEVSYHQDLPKDTVPISGNRDRLTQVLVNLISNAIKFTAPTKGHIDIQLSRDQQTAVLSVRDNGPGIPEDQQKHIFEKFTQVSDQQRGKPTGSGLGLYITRHIIEQHGGQITINSAVGQGATFTITIPLVEEV